MLNKKMGIKFEKNKKNQNKNTIKKKKSLIAKVMYIKQSIALKKLMKI